VSVQEVRWDKGGSVRARDYIFFYEKGNENHQLGFLVCACAYMCVCVWLVYIYIYTLNGRVTSEEKSDDSKDSVYEELE
jgi:hypothetical protein